MHLYSHWVNRLLAELTKISTMSLIYPKLRSRHWIGQLILINLYSLLSLYCLIDVINLIDWFVNKQLKCLLKMNFQSKIQWLFYSKMLTKTLRNQANQIVFQHFLHHTKAQIRKSKKSRINKVNLPLVISV